MQDSDPWTKTGGRSRHAIWAAGWMALVLTGAACARDLSHGAPPPFELTIRSENVAGHDPFQRAFVAAGAMEFSVLVPGDHIAVVRGLDTLMMVSADNVSSISVTRVEIGARPDKEPTIEDFRTATLEQFPGASILEETQLGAGDRMGPAFDLKWAKPGQGAQYLRVAYVPSSAGLLRFCAMTVEARSAQAGSDLATVMGTFIAGPRGQLDVPKVSGRY